MQITPEEEAKVLVADSRSVRYAALAIGKPETSSTSEVPRDTEVHPTHRGVLDAES
jgi:hypothetical protein